MALVTVADVEARLGRTFAGAERTRADALVADVTALVRSRIPDVDSRAADTNYAALLVAVLAKAVVRVLQNPEGLQSETVGEYSYTRANTEVAGVWVPEDDLVMLGADDKSAGAFTIQTGPQ